MNVSTKWYYYIKTDNRNIFTKTKNKSLRNIPSTEQGINHCLMKSKNSDIFSAISTFYALISIRFLKLCFLLIDLFSLIKPTMIDEVSPHTDLFMPINCHRSYNKEWNLRKTKLDMPSAIIHFEILGWKYNKKIFLYIYFIGVIEKRFECKHTLRVNAS